MGKTKNTGYLTDVIAVDVPTSDISIPSELTVGGLANADVTKVVSVDVAGKLILVDGGAGASARFGIEDVTGIQDRAINMDNKELSIDNTKDFSITSGAFSGLYAGVGAQYNAGDPLSQLYARNGDASIYNEITVQQDTVFITSGGNSYGGGNGSKYIPLSVSVNGGSANYADTAGNINITENTPNLQAVTDVGAFTTNNIALINPAVLVYLNEDFSQGSSLFNNVLGFAVAATLPASAGTLAISVNSKFSDFNGNVLLVNTIDNYVNDAAAAIAGISIGGLYHTSGVVKIRLS